MQFMKLKLEITRLMVALAALVAGNLVAGACTSAVVGRDVTRDGRTLLWKHRDSGHPHNFVDRVERTDSTMAYVALFNAGDRQRAEAWIGFNEAGFAVMNTASYNLAPDTAAVKDREGVVMSRALAVCRTVEDFDSLLHAMQSAGTPIGVQANFGVTDAAGNGAYFETSDHAVTRFDLADEPRGAIIRSNYSYSGGTEGRLGEVRHDNAEALLANPLANRAVVAETFTETMSRSFFHAGHGKDMAAAGYSLLTDRGEYIPRRSSCASVVIEGCRNGENPASATVMWVAIGFPAASHVVPVTLNDIPAELLPTAPGGHSPLCDEVNRRREKAFPRKGREGKWLIDLNYLLPVMDEQRRLSAENYRRGRQQRDAQSLMTDNEPAAK